MRVRVAFALAFLAVATPVTTGAQAADRRVPVDPNQPPWNAVVKVQTNIGGHCTGVLIAPAAVVTAAHCLYNPHTLGFLQPVSLHVLFGYQRDQYRWHRLVSRVTLGPRVSRTPGPQETDWARLDLAEPVPVTPLPRALSVVVGMQVALAGYNQDRAQLLMGDLDCHVLGVTGTSGDALLLSHDCAATRGTSGAPLLIRQNGGWAVIGINIAAGHQSNLALDAPFGD